MEKELRLAEATRRDTVNLVDSFLNDIRTGRSIDVQVARNAVSQALECVLRNPNALMFVNRMAQKSQYMADHSFDVCVFSIILGRLNGLTLKQLEYLGTCGLLHDIGNTEIAVRILNKTSRLSDEEFEVIKRHTLYGKDILISARNIFPGAVDVAYCHHELLDGSGYPRGLTDQHINLNCRVVSIVDKYDAITKNTPYRSALSHLDAAHMINLMAIENKIDRRLTASFLSYLGFYPPGGIVELSTGEVAIVLRPNAANRLRPLVLIVRDGERAPLERIVDLAITPNDARGRPYKIKTVHLPGYLGIDASQYKNAIIQAFE